MNRGTTLALGLTAVVASAGVGWAAGRQITSPAELAARAEPPTPSLITVAVERRKLSADVIVRAEVAYDDPVSVELSGAIGMPGEAAVVTRAPEIDAELAEGDVAIEVAGRPVLLLEGVIPVYRDLRPGAVGLDVLQLEEALTRLGHFTGTPDQEWTSDTGAAIQAWYDAAGYRANAATKSEEEQLDAARARVKAARENVTSSEQAITDAKEISKSAMLTAEANVSTGRENLDIALLRETGANVQAAAAVAAAETGSADAQAALALANARLAQAEGGTHPDTGMPPTAEEMTVLQDAVSDAEDGLAAAQSILDVARQTALETEAEQASLVRQATDEVSIAEALLVELKAPPDTTPLQAQLTAAREELTEALADQAEIAATVGTWIPAGELAFLDRMPVRVDRVSVSLGSIVSGPYMTVSGADISIRANVDENDAGRIHVGSVGFIDDIESEQRIEAVVESISEHGTGGRVPVELAVDALPDELIGRNVRLVIPVEATEGSVLAVPAAALSAIADGSVRVEVEDPDSPGTTRFVTVVPGLAADGLVEVTPVNGSLEKGDRVVVGLAAGGDA